MKQIQGEACKAFHRLEGYGFDDEVDGVQVSCCISESALTRWGPGLGCAPTDFRRLRHISHTILASHLRMAGAHRGEQWIANITADVVALAMKDDVLANQP